MIYILPELAAYRLGSIESVSVLPDRPDHVRAEWTHGHITVGPQTSPDTGETVYAMSVSYTDPSHTASDWSVSYDTFEKAVICLFQNSPKITVRPELSPEQKAQALCKQLNRYCRPGKSQAEPV